MKAVLRTYDASGKYEDKPVEVPDDFNFANGPYGDEIKFTVGSNQALLPCEEDEIVLSATSYFVLVVEQTVTFTESRPVAFVEPDKFKFEKLNDVNNSPGIWYFEKLSKSKVPASAVTSAYIYCTERFGKNFEPFIDAVVG